MDTTTTIVLVVVALLVLAAIAFIVMRNRKRKSLQSRFGPEYERTVSSADSRRDAERELKQRAAEHDRLDIRPLDPVRRDGFANRWRQTQEDFVDHPAEAVTAAQALVTEVMQERGYPVGDVDTQVRHVSVDHADVVEEYRAAHRISQLNDRKEATTEQLRQAMVHYRSLFGRLLDTGDGDRRDGDPYPPDQRREARDGTP